MKGSAVRIRASARSISKGETVLEIITHTKERGTTFPRSVSLSAAGPSGALVLRTYATHPHEASPYSYPVPPAGESCVDSYDNKQVSARKSLGRRAVTRPYRLC
jgi:hypothetical protein